MELEFELFMYDQVIDVANTSWLALLAIKSISTVYYLDRLLVTYSVSLSVYLLPHARLYCAS